MVTSSTAAFALGANKPEPKRFGTMLDAVAGSVGARVFPGIRLHLIDPDTWRRRIEDSYGPLFNGVACGVEAVVIEGYKDGHPIFAEIDTADQAVSVLACGWLGDCGIVQVYLFPVQYWEQLKQERIEPDKIVRP